MQSLATSKEVAAYLGVHPQSMDRWASQNKGPRYTKIEGIRRYDWADVKGWVEENKTPAADGPRWQCSACGKPVTQEGHLVVSIDRAAAGDADWGVLHDWCPRPPTPNPYLIAIERALTWPELAGWIAHLLEKDWAHNTDLAGLLRKAGARD